MALFLPLLLLAGVLTRLAYVLYRAASDPLRSVPGPLLARFTRLWYLNAVHQGKFEEVNIQLHRKYGPIVRVGPNMYSFDDPEATAVIYNSVNVFPKSLLYSTFQIPGEPNIFSTTNNRYAADMRKKYKPAFDAFQTYEGAVDNCVGLLARRLSEAAEKSQSVDIGWWLTCFAFDINGEIGFSKRFGHLDEGKDVGGIAAALAERLDYVARVGIYPFLHPIFWNLIMIISFLSKKVDPTYDFAQAQIDAMQKNGVGKEKLSAAPSMLERYLTNYNQDPNYFTKQDVLMGAMISLAAGADTTWISLGTIFHFLHANPETLRKLRAEIDQFTAEDKVSDPVTAEEGRKMPYLNAVIKEAQRMHAPIGLPMWRIVPESGATICGRFVPAGTTVGVNSWVAQHSSIFRPDPDTFRPERWLEASPDQLQAMHACHLPFGVGPRVCQGQAIALMEMQKLIPQLLRKFEFEIDGQWETVNHWLVGYKNLTGKVKLIE